MSYGNIGGETAAAKTPTLGTVFDDILSCDKRAAEVRDAADSLAESLVGRETISSDQVIKTDTLEPIRDAACSADRRLRSIRRELDQIDYFLGRIGAGL